MKWLLPRGRSAGTRWNSAKYEAYDKTTGQVYLEHTVALQTSDDRNWARDCRPVEGPDFWEAHVRASNAGSKVQEEYQKRLDGLKNSNVISSRGARSLQDAAIECVLENLSDITLEGIECLPIPIVQRIWRAVNKRDLKCFNLWSIFATVLCQHNPIQLDLLRYHGIIKAPSCPLDVYTNPLNSKSYAFITSLSITTSFPVPDLIKLASITNLGVLEIINTQGCENMTVGDRLIRSWYLAALNEDAFSVLRILRLWKHEGLTNKSFDYLHGFPALAVYDIRGCSFDYTAKAELKELGWKASYDNDILGVLESTCVKRSSSMRGKLGMKDGTSKVFRSEQLWDGASVKRLPRGDIPMFLAQAGASPGDTVETSRMKANLNDSEQAQTKFHDRRRQAATQSYLDSWDIPAYRAFARIGELRNDTDLVRAGVEVGDQAVVGNELVNSFPMVSLRLGETPKWISPTRNSSFSSFVGDFYHDGNTPFLIYDWEGNSRPASSIPRGPAFIRIKAPPPSPPDLEVENKRCGVLEPLAQNLAGGEPLSSQSTASKRRVSGVVRNKKRKLDDVLSSFM